MAVWHWGSIPAGFVDIGPQMPPNEWRGSQYDDTTHQNLGLSDSNWVRNLKTSNYKTSTKHPTIEILLCLSVQRCFCLIFKSHTQPKVFFGHSPGTTPVSNVKTHVKHLQSGEKAWSSQPDFFADLEMEDAIISKRQRWTDCSFRDIQPQ
jgi:hypothetical protein